MRKRILATGFALAAGMPHLGWANEEAKHAGNGMAGKASFPAATEVTFDDDSGGGLHAAPGAKKTVISSQVARVLGFAALGNTEAGKTGWRLEFGLPRSVAGAGFAPEPERKEARLGLAMRLGF